MANPASDDPFLEVQRDVQITLQTTRHLFSSYLRIRTHSKNASSPELLQSRTELQTNLYTLSNDLTDLLDTIAAVESDPYSFGLDVAEVQRRREFVKEVGDEVESMHRELVEEIGEAGSIAGITKGGGGTGRGLPNPAAFEDASPDSEDEDAYAEFESAQQQTMMRDQDEQLEGVFQSVGVLRSQAQDMGRELEEQGTMLEDVDKLADRVGGKLNTGMKKMREVIRKNEDKASSCCIGVLILVLIILLVLVIII